MNKDIYRNIAAVTAIFIISLSVMLITNYFQVRGVTPVYFSTLLYNPLRLRTKK